MEFDLMKSVGLLLAIVAIAIAGLASAGFMDLSTVLMMVLPSMLVFAAIAFFVGMKHGEYRAGY
ncbi:hypothetical protein BRC91_05810 [Halobacteriales archaeon QS_4_62_28]|nr:MAG: hypothetical protein BRC91_05810 [Halobacteriales archaeon QS_4_62_28]